MKGKPKKSSNSSTVTSMDCRNLHQEKPCAANPSLKAGKLSLESNVLFDENEMPSNTIHTTDKPSRIAGLVLSRRTGFVVAHQRGTLMDIEIT